MRDLLTRALLCVAALAVPLSTDAGPADLPQDRAITFLSGRIGAGAEVRMMLRRRGSQIDGSYYYLRFNRTIYIGGTIDDASGVSLSERDPRSGKLATFKGTFDSGNRFSGTWTSADKSRSLPFVLDAVPVPTTDLRADDVIEVPHDAFVKAYGEKPAATLGFREPRFSPDGRLLAFVISTATSNDVVPV